MGRKLAVSDFDGTMYEYSSENKDVPSINKEGIADWRKAGNVFSFCTGRNTKSMLLEIERQNIPYDYLICNSGAIILNNAGEELYKNTIPSDVLQKLIASLELDHCIEIMVSTKDYMDAVILNKEDSHLMKYLNMEQYKDYQLVRLKDNLNQVVTDDVLQFTLSMDDPAATLDYVAKLKEMFPDQLQINHNLTFIDICAVGINKVQGIRQLLALIGNDFQDIITIGDAQNDVEMLKTFTGYTLEHATADAKEVAKAVFPSVGDMLRHRLAKD